MSSIPTKPGLPKKTLFAYGISDFPITLATMPLMLYMNFFYSSEFGLDLVDMGTMMLLARVFDLITDPLVGYLSDHTRTRWGRRRPWMVASVPFMMVGIYQVMIPDADADLWYLFTWLMVLWLGWTMLMIPYYAWGAELTTDYHDRSRVTGWRAAMGSVGQLVAISFPVVMATFFTLDGFRELMQITAYAALVLTPLCVAYTVWQVDEKPNANAPAMQLFDGLKVMLRNGAFLWLVIAFVTSSLGLAIAMPLSAFYATAVLGASQNLVPFLMFFGTFAGIAGIPFWIAVSKKYGKHRAWIGGFLLVASFSPMYLFFGPGDFWLMVPFAAISAFGTGSFIALPNSMKADVIDIDTARTGENRAAQYFSAWSLATKAASSLGATLGLWALGWVDYEASKGSLNTPEAIQGLKYIYTFLPASSFVLAALIIWKYPITKERQSRIRAAIDRRDKRRARKAQ
ncbi:MAG: GPH family glycoside/pentoside/hexuronide:cation symporter [Limisphaerales bacterium]|jgi:GPH family glycoside/pentoside/hexuronide:cation symporter